MISSKSVSPGRLISELLAAGTVFFGFRFLVDFKYDSQVAVLLTLIAITFLIRQRGVAWRDLGLTWPERPWRALLLFLLCVVSIGLVFNFVIAPLFPQGANDINNGQVLSLGETLFQLFFIAILGAAMGEEMLFRGFLLNNLNGLLGENKAAAILAVLLQAVVFGVLHSGIQGMVSAGVIGVILGVFYLFAGRNLLVVMAAHAVPDILSVISSYQNQ